jgi:hypothetical protein
MEHGVETGFEGNEARLGGGAAKYLSAVSGTLAAMSV